MFVHQEEWQQRLLLWYASKLVLRDASYKTTKYAIPLSLFQVLKLMLDTR